MTQQRLTGRIAIITGASRGLGRHMAETFAAEGAAVVVAARSEAMWDERLPGTIHEVAKAINDGGGRAIAVACDVAIEADLQKLVSETEAAFGACDLLVNNAALTLPGGPGRVSRSNAPSAAPAAPAAEGTRIGGSPGILEMSLGGYRRHFEVGLFASYRLMQLVLPAMIAQRRGSIINISSSASRHPGEGPYPESLSTFIAYGGNKIALEHLSRGVAAQVAQYGITVNSLSPSAAIDTPGVQWVSRGRAAMRTSPIEEFSESALLLALDRPEQRTGINAYHADILSPGAAPQGWVG